MLRSALALGGLLMPMQAASALLLPATRHIATSRGLLSRLAPKTCRALSMGAAGAEGQEALDFGSTRLYPQPPLVAGGMLAVSELHTVAWYEYGNPAGKPALFVHGGPGGGTAPMNARYFDPALYRIILVDQRGCGKSTPFAELEENTTPDLVADFEQIRLLLAIDTWQVFGGSWGSTLALAYAVAHPERVTELVLRGVFLLRRKELDFFYEGRGTNFLFPEQVTLPLALPLPLPLPLPLTLTLTLTRWRSGAPARISRARDRVEPGRVLRDDAARRVPKPRARVGSSC